MSTFHGLALDEVDRLKKQLLDVHDALHHECDGTADLPKEIRQMRTTIDGLRAENTAVRGHAAALYVALHEVMIQRVPADSIAPEALKARKALEDYSL